MLATCSTSVQEKGRSGGAFEASYVLPRQRNFIVCPLEFLGLALQFG